MELNNKKMNNQDRKIFREAVEAKLAQCEFNPEKRFTLINYYLIMIKPVINILFILGKDYARLI